MSETMERIKECGRQLYDDIVCCIDNLCRARSTKDSALERMALARMESLMTATMQHLQVVDDYSPWIAVTEALPDKDTDVLVTNGHGDYFFSYRPTYADRVVVDRNGFNNPSNLNITHWMPMPSTNASSDDNQPIKNQ